MSSYLIFGQGSGEHYPNQLAQIYCDVSAQGYTENDWFQWNDFDFPREGAHPNRKYMDVTKYQVIDGGTSIVAYSNGIIKWSYPKYCPYLFSDQEVSGSLKWNGGWGDHIPFSSSWINRDEKEGIDWKLVTISDDGNILFIPHKSPWITISKFDWENQTCTPKGSAIRTPDGEKFDGECVFLSEKIIVIIHKGRNIFAYDFNSEKWHSIFSLGVDSTAYAKFSSSGNSRVRRTIHIDHLSSIISQVQANEDGSFEFVAIDRYNKLTSVLFSITSSGLLEISTQLIHDYKTEGFEIITVNDGSTQVFVTYNHDEIYIQTRTNSSFSKAFRFPHPFDFHDGWPVLCNLGKSFAIMNSTHIMKFNSNFSKLEVEQSQPLNWNAEEEPNELYICMDYWKIVDSTLRGLLESESSLNEYTFDLATYLPNILNACLESKHEILTLYLELLNQFENKKEKLQWLQGRTIYGGNTPAWELITNGEFQEDQSLDSFKNYKHENDSHANELVAQILDTIHRIISSEDSSDPADQPLPPPPQDEGGKGENVVEVSAIQFGDYFEWPSTAAEPSWHGIDDADPDSWPKVGVLKRLGYSVATRDGVASQSVRSNLLDTALLSARLPFVKSYDHMLEWGPARSCARLRKIANVLAHIGKRERRRGWNVPVGRRDEDLAYLKSKYYDNSQCSRNFDWPSTWDD